MMKNIILFQPSIGYMDVMRTKPSLPLSLLHAVSVASKYYDIKIIDQRLHQDWKKQLTNHLSDDTICVGVTSMTGSMIKEGVKFSKYVKDNYKVPVVWGGIHASMLPAQTVENKYIDIVVEGEGEHTFYELVKAMAEGRTISDVSGIWYKKNGSALKTSNRDFVNLNNLPDIPYHLINIDSYLPLYRGRRSIYFQSSRGCPFRCSYCYNCVYNHGRWRCFSAEKTLQRLQNLISKHGKIEDVYFVDDNFFIDIERSRKIINGLKEMNITWQVQGVDIVSLKKMDNSFLKLLQDSGCQRLTLGVESGSHRVRKLMNKKGTAEDVLSFTERVKKYDLVVYCSFLVGIPGETKEDIKETISLLLKMLKINKKIRNSPFYIYTPYPKTQMYDMIVQKGYNPPSTLQEWAECEWDKVTYAGNKKFYSSLHFVSLFLDKKTTEYDTPRIVKILADIYRPLAKFRVKNLYFKFMFERYAYDIIKKLWFRR